MVVFFTLVMHDGNLIEDDDWSIGNKMLSTMVSFILEDLIQMTLQFLYFEKYSTSLDWFPVLNGVFMVVIAILFVKKIWDTDFILCVCVFFQLLLCRLQYSDFLWSFTSRLDPVR